MSADELVRVPALESDLVIWSIDVARAAEAPLRHCGAPMEMVRPTLVPHSLLRAWRCRRCGAVKPLGQP